MAHPVMHWEIGGKDAGALRQFYADLFDWQITGAGPEYALVAPAEGGMGGGIMQNPADVPPYVTVYVAVDDLDAALADAARLGGGTVVGPTVISDNMSFAMFRDPEGNVIGLLEQAGPVEG